MMVSNGQVRVWQQPGEVVRSGLSSGHVMVRQQSDEGRQRSSEDRQLSGEDRQRSGKGQQWSCQGSPTVM